MATITSNQSGNWSDVNTWVGGIVPTTGDKAIIANTHNVLIDTNLDVGDNTNEAVHVQTGGVLDIHRTNNLTVEITGRLYIAPNGRLGTSSEADRITGEVVFQLNKGNGNGTNFGLLCRGNFSIYGSPKTTNTVTTVQSLTGSNTITVNSGSGWQIGDSLVIRRQDEFAGVVFHRPNITNVSGNVITFDTALPFDIGIDAPVGNRTKNIRFEQHPNANVGRNTSFYHENIFGTVEGEHFSVKNTDSNTNTSQGMYTFRSTNDPDRCTVNISDVCLLANNNLIRGLEFEAFRIPSATFNNLLLDMEVGGQNQVYPRSGSTAIIQNSVFYGGGAFNSGWGQGSSSMLVKNCKLLGNGSTNAISFSTCITYTFEDCLIIGGEFSFRYVSFTDVGLVVFRRCAFGSTQDGWDIVKTRIHDSSGTNGNQIVLFEDCTDTCTEDEMVEYGGNNTFTAVSDSSYMWFRRQNLTEEELYRKGGYLSLSNERVNLATKAVRFERKFIHDLFHLWNAFIPSNVNVNVSAFAYRNESYQRVTDIHSSATAGTGVVTWSSAFSNEGGWRVFDNTTSQRWIPTAAIGEWVSYQFNAATTIQAYAITAPRIAWIDRSPISWRILGSNTGAFSGEETIVDQQINVPFWTDFERRVYQITPATFLHFRLEIDAIQSGGIGEITELEYLEIAPITTPRLDISSDSGISANQSMSSTAEQWEALTSQVQQTTGGLERLDMNFVVSDGLSGDLAYIDFIALSAYGYRSIFKNNLALNPDGVLFSEQLSLIPEITQTEAVAASHTGISIVEGTQNLFGFDFDIVIVGNTSTNPALTLEDIKHYLHYHRNRIAAFEGRETGYHWHDLVPIQGTGTKRSSDNKGVAVVDQDGNPFIGITAMEANTGVYNPPQVYIGTVSNIVSGSRLQIYNVTTDAEIYNNVVNSTSYSFNYTEGVNINNNDQIRIRITYQSGITAKLGFSANTIANNGFSVLVDQQDDLVYNQIAQDGSTINKFDADFANNEVDIVATGNFSAFELYARFVYFTFTEQGIRSFFGALVANDIANFENKVDVLDLYLNNNTSANIRQTDNPRLFKSNGAYPVREPTSSGFGVDVVWREKVLVTQNEQDFEINI